MGLYEALQCERIVDAPLFQRHLAIEKTILELKEACLEIAHQLDNDEEKATAYAQAQRYDDALRAIQDFFD